MQQAQEISGVEPPPVHAARVLELGKQCLIRDVALLKAELLGALDVPEAVVIDPAAIERVDTAALQLLLAFERDRRANGHAVIWRAGSDAFSQAVAMLGLTLGTDAAAAR